MGDLIDLTNQFDDDDIPYEFLTDDLPDIQSNSRHPWRNETGNSQSSSSSLPSNSTYSSVDSTEQSSENSVLSKKAAAEKTKARKEAEKAENARKREEKRKQKEEEKKLKEEEKNDKASARKVAKSQRPGLCMQYITVTMEQSLLQTGIGAKLLPLLQEAEVQYRFENFSIEKMVCWRRESPCTNDSEMAGDDPDDESQVLVIVPVEDFTRYVHASAAANADDDVTLSLFVAQLLDNLPGKRLTVAVQGVEKYFRTIKTLNQRQYRQNVQTAAGVVEPAKKGGKKLNVDVVISRLDLEQVLVDMELESTVNFKFLETDEELAKLITMMTKAVAEAPFKRTRHDVGFSFLPDNKNTVKVNSKDGEGLIKLWTNQFLQFHNVSPDVARAIVGEFPSPLSLLEAYASAPSRREAENLLADIRVRRGAGVLETSRRIGRELSRRVYEFFNCDDPTYILK